MAPEKKYDLGDEPHGTTWGYRQGCREECCKAAKREHNRKEREARIEFGKRHPEHIPHGTDNGYINWGCRCVECFEIHRQKKREYLARKKQEREQAKAQQAKAQQEKENGHENG